MDAASLACAPSGMTWDGINWSKVLGQVRRLQARIVKATQAGRHNKVKALQWLLTHSFSGKALSVKRVSFLQKYFKNSNLAAPATLDVAIF